MFKPLLSTARLALATLASGALLSACAAPVPVVPVVPAPAAPAAVAPVGVVATPVDRTVLDSKTMTVAIPDKSLAVFVVDGQEVAGVNLSRDINVRAVIDPEAEGAAGKEHLALSAMEIRVAGYNPVLTKWFLSIKGKPGGDAYLVYRDASASSGSPALLTYAFTQATPSYYEVAVDEDGVLTTAILFTAASITTTGRASAAGAKPPAAAGPSWDFIARKPTGSGKLDAAGKAAPTQAFTGEQSSVIVDGALIGRSTRGSVLSLAQDITSGDGESIVVEPLKIGNMKFDVAGFNETLSLWTFSQSRLPVSFGFTSPAAADKALEVLQFTYTDCQACDYAFSDHSSVDFWAKGLTITEIPLDAAGKAGTAITTSVGITGS